MLFPHNGSHDDIPASAPWSDWVNPGQTSAGQTPAPADDAARAGGHAPHTPAPTDIAGADWTDWIPAEPVAPVKPGDAAEALEPDNDRDQAQRGAEWGSTTLPAATAVPATGGPKARRRRGAVIAAGVAVLAGGAVIAGSAVLLSTRHTAVPAVSATPAHPPAAVTTTDPVLGGGTGCEATRTPTLVRGNGTGGTGSGPDVILAFQHAYYVARSGQAARTFTTPDAAVSPPEVIDAGIATVPPRAAYCVQVEPAGDGQYAVVIVETRPDQSVRTYRQLDAVAAQPNNQFLITRIGAAQ